MFITNLGRGTIDTFVGIGKSARFLCRIIFRRPKFIRSFPLLIEQIYAVGVLSLPIIILAGVFIGMVISLQGFNTLQKFGAEQELGQLLALSIVRELGPVVTALLFAGRAGSALTAELGLMRATDQLNAMDMMAVDSVWRVVAPRFFAGLISLPLLTILFNLVAIYGGYLVGVIWLGVDYGSFWNNMQSSVSFRYDVVNGIIKSLVFGVVVCWIAVYQGFYAAPNAAGMANSTTKSVVYSSLLILAFDFVLTAMMMGGW